MKHALIIVLAAAGICGVAGGGALLAITAKDENHGLIITLLAVAFVIFAVDWLARHFREVGVLAGRAESEQLYTGLGRRKGEA